MNIADQRVECRNRRAHRIPSWIAISLQNRQAPRIDGTVRCIIWGTPGVWPPWAVLCTPGRIFGYRRRSVSRSWPGWRSTWRGHGLLEGPSPDAAIHFGNHVLHTRHLLVPTYQRVLELQLPVVGLILVTPRLQPDLLHHRSDVNVRLVFPHGNQRPVGKFPPVLRPIL